MDLFNIIELATLTLLFGYLYLQSSTERTRPCGAVVWTGHGINTFNFSRALETGARTVLSMGVKLSGGKAGKRAFGVAVLELSVAKHRKETSGLVGSLALPTTALDLFQPLNTTGRLRLIGRARLRRALMFP